MRSVRGERIPYVLYDCHYRPAQCRQIDPVQPAGRPAASRWSMTTPGVTRDRREGDAQARRPANSRLIDTAGLEEAGAEGSLARTHAVRRPKAAIAGCRRACCFVIDARAWGCLPDDTVFAPISSRTCRQARGAGREQERGQARRRRSAMEAYALGLGDPVSLSPPSTARA
jgi:predicted GTPase